MTSDKDLRGLRLWPVMGLERRSLSKSASTDSCSIRFSLRVIISGALSSSSLFKRLFRLMTRLYRSFKSEVAKRPPSRGTSGLSSGGKIGITSSTIHSGLLPESSTASTVFNRLVSLASLVSALVAAICALRLWLSSFKSMFLSISRIASAPMPTRNSSPYSSNASRYSSSVMI